MRATRGRQPPTASEPPVAQDLGDLLHPFTSCELSVVIYLAELRFQEERGVGRESQMNFTGSRAEPPVCIFGRDSAVHDSAGLGGVVD